MKRFLNLYVKSQETKFGKPFFAKERHEFPICFCTPVLREKEDEGKYFNWSTVFEQNFGFNSYSFIFRFCI